MIKNFFIPTKSNGYLPYSLRRTALTIYTLLLLLLNLFFGTFGKGALSEVSASSITAGTLIAYANQERANSGLGQLTTNSQLTAAAYAKANDMILKNYWAHYGPNGESPWQFILGAGYSYVHAGENLAKGFTTSEGVHQAWMASPTHRANIMSGNYRDIGIAVVEGQLQGQQTILVVQMFGSLASGGAQQANPTPTYQPPSQPQFEQGEIKSISISRPEAGTTLTDPMLKIEGSVDVEGGVQGSYTVEVYEDEVKIAADDSESEEWLVENETELEDGSHEIVTKVEQDGNTHTDTVAFAVDTTAPPFSKDLTQVIYLENNQSWEVKTLVEEADVVAALIIGDQTFLLTTSDDGFLKVEIPETIVESANSIILSITDKHGNSGEFEILNYFAKPIQEKSVLARSDEAKNSKYLGALSLIKDLDSRSLANIFFVCFIFLLLLVQVYYYHKLGMLDKKGGYLFTLGAWIFILLVVTTVGAVGELA